jgi:hypothetical protein
LAREHQDEFVECSCTEDQIEPLISKLKSYGATNAEEGVCSYNNNYKHTIPLIISVVKHVKFADANYCVVKFSIVRDVGLIVKVLKAFPVSQLK